MGTPSITDGFYRFDESPACNYPETVTVTNLPAFMSHDVAASEFTIERIDDLSLIGAYTISVKSEIQIPDDPSLSSYSTLSASYDLVVYV